MSFAESSTARIATSASKKKYNATSSTSNERDAVVARHANAEHVVAAKDAHAAFAPRLAVSWPATEP